MILRVASRLYNFSKYLPKAVVSADEGAVILHEPTALAIWPGAERADFGRPIAKWGRYRAAVVRFFCMTPEQLDEHARKFLAKLFAETKGRRNAFCEDEEIGAAVGLDADATLVVTSYLEGCGLVEQFTMAGHVGITAAGISALQSPAPDPGTKVNILHVGQMHGSQIQQGTSHSQQTQINKTVSQDELKRLVGDLVAQFAAVKIPSEQKEDFEATIQTLEVQSRVSKPKAEVVRPLLNHLVEFAVIFGADLASATLTAFMHAHGWIP